MQTERLILTQVGEWRKFQAYFLEFVKCHWPGNSDEKVTRHIVVLIAMSNGKSGEAVEVD
jgi:hypothetical protein